MRSALTTELIEDQDALTRLAPEWWELWEGSRAATPFQSPAWLIAWWRAFAPGALLTLAVRRGQRLVAVAPFYAERCGARARLLPLGISISDYHDILVEPPLARPALAAISGAYGQMRSAWSEWELPELPAGATALAMPVPDACHGEERPDTSCPVLVLPCSVAELQQTLPARKRRSLRMLHHRIRRNGAASIVSAVREHSQWWVGELMRLHGACWECRGQRGVLADARLLPFHTEVGAQFAARGLSRWYALELDGTVVGIYYGFHHGDRAYGYLTGFDPQFAYFSPGSFLLAHAIEQAIAEGASEFHFLRGGEAYKYAWGAEPRCNRRRVIWRGVS